MQSSIKIHLPETTRNPLTAQNSSIRVVITKTNDVYINDKPVAKVVINNKTNIDFVSLDEAMKDVLAQSTVPFPVVVYADKDCNYGVVARVLAVAQAAGAPKLDLITKTDNLAKTSK
jgi:biopolymer transport protein ExbD